MKGCHLRFIRRFSSGCFFVAVKQRGHAICNFFLPCVDLARVHPVTGHNQLPKLILGVKFTYGIEVFGASAAPQAAA